MKILSIRLKNLNSLKGDHLVDFTAEPLASAGLFAITGPTGAGKSTLLDAITLALYGKAARYGSEANPEHVMSRHTGECEAEVVFEVPSGVYRAVWQRHRARKKPDGALQQPKRYIYDMAGQPLTQQIREAEEKIEALIGLDYGRFLRSAMLAQGEFSRFLKSNNNERAELLESLTGTEIYSRLGAMAHAEATRRDNELKSREAILGQIEILSGEERAGLEMDLEKATAELKELAGQIDAGAAMRTKIDRLEAARSKEASAALALEQAEKQAHDSANDLERLRRHLLTIPFAEPLAHYDSAEVVLAGAKAKLEEAERNHAEALTALHQANHHYRMSIENALQGLRGQIKESGQQATAAADEVRRGRQWLDEHPEDGSLEETLGDLMLTIEGMKSMRRSLTGKWEAWRGQAAEIMPAEAGHLPSAIVGASADDVTHGIRVLLERAGERQVELNAAVTEAGKQLELRKDHLEKATIIASMKDHRHVLVAGEPCPLCGALEHPYARGAAPNPQLAELKAEVSAAATALSRTEDAHRNHAATARKLDEDAQGLRKDMGEQRLLLERLKSLLVPLSVDVPEMGKEDELRRALQKRNQAWREHVKAVEEADGRRKDAERQVEASAEKAMELDRKQQKLGPLPEDFAAKAIPSKRLGPVAEAEEVHANAIRNEHATRTHLDARKGDHKAAVDAHALARDQLTAALAGSEFKDIGSMRLTRIAAQEARNLEKLKAGIEKAGAKAQTLLAEARKDIQGLLGEQVLEGAEAESFKARQAELSARKDQSLQDQRSCQDKIERDDNNRKSREARARELASEQAALSVWKHLQELIGSADGSKFRRYAQAITLDILTRHANRHLIKLSDRYRICRDEGQELTLQVEDLHQAGVRRPMASLSGGESFLVSLALALGLSDLAGRTVRIDSLFVDEGFGSLDPETLEVAIAALEGLMQNRKSVGVISHVGLLKERISTQIVVEKLTGGESRIIIAG